MVNQIMRVEIVNSLKLSKAGINRVYMMVEQSDKGVTSRIFSSGINDPFGSNWVKTDAFWSESLVKIEVSFRFREKDWKVLNRFVSEIFIEV